MSSRIVAEHHDDCYLMFIERSAMPGPTKSWQAACFSEEEAVKKFRELLKRLPRLTKHHPEVKKALAELKTELSTVGNQTRKRTAKAIAGID